MKKNQTQKLTISKRAVITRINRKLRQQPNPEVLRAARSQRQADEVGDYFTVDDGTPGEPQKSVSQGVGRVYVDLEKLGRELGVFQPWEQME